MLQYLSRLIFVFSVILLLTYIGALSYDWYLTTWYVDAVQHFIAGAIFALLWLWFNRKSSKKVSAMSIIGFVLLLALAWEVFEFALQNQLYKYSLASHLYSLSVDDLLTDLLADLAGGLVVVKLYLKHV